MILWQKDMILNNLGWHHLQQNYYPLLALLFQYQQSTQNLYKLNQQGKLKKSALPTTHICDMLSGDRPHAWYICLYIESAIVYTVGKARHT